MAKALGRDPTVGGGLSAGVGRGVPCSLGDREVPRECWEQICILKQLAGRQWALVPLCCWGSEQGWGAPGPFRAFALRLPRSSGVDGASVGISGVSSGPSLRGPETCSWESPLLLAHIHTSQAS